MPTSERLVVRDILEAEVAIRCLKGGLTADGICSRNFSEDEKDDIRRVIGRLLDGVWRSEKETSHAD